MRIPELLAPAGTYETLIAVCNAGADAVYAAGTKYGARAYAGNLSEDELLSAISYVHLHGKKLYLTLNTLIKNSEFDDLYEYLLPLYVKGLDGIIVQDIGVIDYLRRQFPLLPVHISTQATVTGEEAVSFFKEKGACRVVLARELSLDEISNIRKNTDMELEIFVHGALCYSYSGMCFYSSLIGGRSGNRGRCAQPCRMNYSINSKERDWMSLKDLSVLYLLDKICETGVDSLKIEGRMKSTEYAAGVTSIYRKYLDQIKENKGPFKVVDEDIDNLIKLYQRRGFSDGYFYRHNGPDMLIEEGERIYNNVAGKKEIDSFKKIPVVFSAYFSSGSEAVLVIEDMNNNIVTVMGDICHDAVNKALDINIVKDKLSRVNDTPLEVSGMNIEINGDIFLPLSSLNSLRREAVDAYLSLIDGKYVRTAPEKIDLERDFCSSDSCKEYSASFLTLKQGYTLSECSKISRVYFPFDLYFSDYDSSMELIEHLKSRDISVFLSLPEIFRLRTKNVFKRNLDEIKDIFDGFLIKNIDELEFMHTELPDADCIIDFTLYSFNFNAVNVLRTYYKKITASIELNFHELKKLDLSGGEIIIYGRYPMMFAANCLKKNSDMCTASGDMISFRDRKGMVFFAKAFCSSCYNVIFNSKYTSLLGVMDKVNQLNVSSYRYSFTDESEKEILTVVNDSQEPKDFTRGHFIRGVE